MSDLHEARESLPIALPYEDMEAETERIIRTGTIWLGAVAVTAALLLGPSVASGWRPTTLPMVFDVAWWLGATAAAIGIGLLVWAGCPVLGFRLPDAYRQKVFSIRVGIVLSLSGMAFSGLVVLLAPVG
ncbi:hypothetical protein [Homoserinibacter sp. GY 40078]|uniref:hypothetical protein n=1 Tax=Homoserinibacter sp. GY 40078 TaxID=2603275 RepID=UPI0011C85BFB|nr:hypothetical protein [Homoserinibacter sp. GY 40078]TXK19788.1 hypothetical protein FVQ89_07990 [Homoserinibacter sp. GY 40078]